MIEINKEWPVKEAEQTRLKEQVPALQEKVALLKAELAQLHQWQLLEQDRELVTKADQLKTNIEKAAKDVDQLAYVTEALVQTLEEQEKNLRYAETSMESATLVAVLDKAPGSVKVTAGFHEPVALKEGQQITANGSLRFEMGEKENAISFRVNAGEIDFEQVKVLHAAAAARKAKILEQLNVSSEEEAKGLLRKKKEREEALRQLQQTYASVVGDKIFIHII